MGKKILSIIITLAVILGTLPVSTTAAETGENRTPTCILEESLILSDKPLGVESEGWKWTPEEAGGGTLELTNCYIQSKTTGIFYFEHLSEGNSSINIILRGENILETTSQVFNYLIGASGSQPIANYTIKEEEKGSLEIRTDKPVTSEDSPYGFAGKSIDIQSGNIKSNIEFCIILGDFSIQSGSLEIHTPADAAYKNGIYTETGTVSINGGTIDIDVSQSGIFIPGFTKQGTQTVNITDGNVNIKAGFSCIHIEKSNLSGEQEQSINITGGNIECYGELTGLYAKNINIVKGGGTAPYVNVSKGAESNVPVIYPRSGKIDISGSVIIADNNIWGYSDNNENSKIENSIIFDGTTGKVHGEVEIIESLEVPENATLSIPENATLSISEDVVLTVPDSAKLQVDGKLVNNGTLILPENSNDIICEGSGRIKKGNNLYTNNNKRIGSVTIIQKGNETTKNYIENDNVELVPEDDTEEMKFKEWKVISGEAITIENNQFTMPAEDIIIEAVFEQFYKLTVKQPSEQTTNYYKKGELIKLEPEQAAEGMRFKEWKVTPATIKITDNTFTMPEEEVTVEVVYEKIPSETETPVETTSPTKAPAQTKAPAPTGTTPPTEPPASALPSPNGNIIVTEPVIGDDAPDGYIADTPDEIKEAVPLTKEEEAAVANGSDIKIYLRIEKKTVTPEEKQIIDAAREDYIIGEYIDVSMFKQIEGKEESPVRQLNKKIEISLVVPENLRNKNNNLTRIYAIIRHHSDEDKAEILQGVYNEKTFTFTFATDCFSTYTIVYKDTEKQTGNVSYPIVNGGGYATDFTQTSSPYPSVKPSTVPTTTPSAVPTASPTAIPTAKPSQTPDASAVPTQEPVQGNVTPAPSQTPSDKTTKEDNALALNAGFKASQNENKIKILWGKVSGADGYDVYVQYCGKKFNAKPSNSIKSGKITKVSVKKINGKKLNLKKSYKLYVTAYKLVNGKKVTLCKSIIAHNAGAKSKKYTNVKNIKVKKVSYTLKEGEIAKINARTILVDKKKKMLSDNHAKEFRYATSDKEVASVSSSGKIKAAGKGSCIIYVYAKNGNAQKITVKVK